MEKLSIEEKAKAYDEAIKRAKDFMNGEAHYELKIGENIMCWVFPELRESEDERIRKEIINYFQCQSQDEPSRKDIHNKWVAWLEKQGEQKPVEWHREDEKVKDNIKGTIKHRLYYAYRNCWLELPEWFK